VVVWRQHGRWLQVMDPAAGRQWRSTEQFLRQVYVHTQRIPVDAWLAWASSPAWLCPLRERMQRLRLSQASQEALVAAALRAADWHPLAALDAALRLVQTLVLGHGLARGAHVATVLQRVLAQPTAIPERYWSTLPDPDNTAQVRLRGAVLLHVAGRGVAIEPDTLPTELAAAVRTPRERPWRELGRAVRADGWRVPAYLMGTAALAAAGTVGEALLWRGLFDLPRYLSLSGQRLAALVALLVFLCGLLLLECPLVAGLQRLGRQLEIRLRVRWLTKLPRLGDRYFQSRLVADMAHRAHTIHQVRTLPDLAGHVLQSLCVLLCTVIGLLWCYPASATLSLLAALTVVGVPLAVQPILAERDQRWREHMGALSRFSLDALLGLTALRAHGGERPLLRVHEAQVREWAIAGLRLHRAVVGAEALHLVLMYGTVAALVAQHLAMVGVTGDLLLLVYWAMSLPTLGQEIALVVRQYPALRNVTLRFLEPLGAPEEERTAAQAPAAESHDGVQIDIAGVTVLASGQTVLQDVTLHIAAGEHVGIVGASGAGKSSLMGLLLGWHRPATGDLLVDGAPLDATRLERLRSVTAWIDPQVQVWNRSLFDNLLYGNPASAAGLETVLDDAGLTDILFKLPEGLQTRLGEGGALLSGGEGQRVRMGRAIMRPDVRLVLLDEPSRGLEHGRRRQFLASARERWKDATLLAITHDVRDVLTFDRVLVLDHGQIVEDGAPWELYDDPTSHYRALCDTEHVVREQIWRRTVQRRLRLVDGRLEEEV